MAQTLNNLANLYYEQGRYAEAEPLFKRPWPSAKNSSGGNHARVASTLSNLANLYWAQGRYAEAEPLLRRSVAINEKVLGREHPDLAQSLHNLANLYQSQGRYAEAEPIYKRALAIWEKVLGSEHPSVALTLNNLANLYQSLGRRAEAEQMHKRALAIREKILGGTHPDVAFSLSNLANLYWAENRLAEAEPLVKRAIDILQNSMSDPELQFKSHTLRHSPLAVETAPGGTGRSSPRYGTGRTVAQAMPREAKPIRRPCSATTSAPSSGWSPGRPSCPTLPPPSRPPNGPGRGRWSIRCNFKERACWRACPRTRPKPSASATAKTKLRWRNSTTARAAGSARGYSRPTAGPAPPGDSGRTGQGPARGLRNLPRHPNASPAYRLMTGRNSSPLDVPTLHRWVSKQQAVLLQYMLGNDAGYLFTVAGDQKLKVVPLTVEEKQAKPLGVKAGALGAEKMQEILHGQGKDLHALLSSPRTAGQAADRLAALWEVLVPAALRSELVGGKYKRLLVAPDGAWRWCPLKPWSSKRVKNQSICSTWDRRSSTVLRPRFSTTWRSACGKTLRPRAGAERGQSPLSGRRAVGGQEAERAVQLASGTRYVLMGGSLSPLPRTENEVDSIVSDFRRAGFSAVALKGRQATEAQVRAQITNRRIVHLACHGLADQRYGNFYGALALTPGNDPDDTANDGFLTLPEIYELNLKGTELAILSACETNFGPQQQGEGVWALSRGFLVAGSRARRGQRLAGRRRGGRQAHQ